ncbi:hypothetical protein TBR22_A21610 [Luteitalea sp. TBR-22]|nr:hypothetical protein TBR22_A21610 [Luteitalea sp. TBR-22]
MAADLLGHWQADGVPARPTLDVLLAATRAHDCGWAEEDDAPTVNPETGAPWDFIHLPLERRQAVWARALRLLADTPHVAALVAHHALTAYARYDGDPAWHEFFRTMTRERDSRVAELAAGGAGSFDGFLRDYASLRSADLISLALCHGWQDRFELDYYKGVPDGPTLTLTPDPFDGAVVAWRVPARRIARRAYGSDTELREAVAAAPVEWLQGQVQGRPEPLPS